MTTNENHEAQVAAFLAKREAIIAKMGGTRTVSQYLADPNRVETIVTHWDVY